MKQLFLYVMILSLLMAVCGCSHEIAPQQENYFENSENPTQGTDTEQLQTGNEPEPSEVQGEEEKETPEIEPPISVPSETEPTEPSEEPPTEPPVAEPPVVTPEVTLLLINELKTEFTATSKRPEYIEFKTLAAGNLNGITLHIMFNEKNPFVYNFPDINVKKGEYIILHLRTVDNNCIDELGDNLNLSTGTDSCSTARDLWVKGSNKILHKTDIVYLQNASGKIIDAIVMNEKPSLTWDKSQSHFTGIVEYLCSVEAWEYEDDYPTAYDAVDTSSIGQSTYKSICRYEWRANNFNTSDWYITDNKTSFVSPGLPNN